ncbi:hypothetical protein GCM10027614_43400 [Micromonospora vulcania]
MAVAGPAVTGGGPLGSTASPDAVDVTTGVGRLVGSSSPEHPAPKKANTAATTTIRRTRIRPGSATQRELIVTDTPRWAGYL